MPSFSEFCNRLHFKESAILYSQSIEKNKKDNMGNKSEQEIDTNSTENDGTSALQISKSCSEHKISKNFRLNDGTLVTIEPEIAEKILYVNEELNTENQALFEHLLNNSIETYEIVVAFCENYN